MTVLTSIRQLLNDNQVDYREVHHEATLTSEDSARVRGESLKIGGKSLLMSGDAIFTLFVLPADRRVDSKTIRKELKLRKLRFATPEELAELTGLVPGCVPPFGHPILPFNLYLDSGIEENDRIAFNAGSLEDSIIMSVPDYLRLARPTGVFSFSKSED